MTNNDVIRRIRYIFDFGDDKMISLFAQADCDVTREQVSNWLKKADQTEYQVLSDTLLASFLNGLINDRRGNKDGASLVPEATLTNNIILRKLKIALDFKDEDMLGIMSLADQKMSRHELSAFFRKVGHKHYRDCKNQILRNFLKGLQKKYRGN